MPRLPLSAHGTTAHERLIGHNPVVLREWLRLEEALFVSPTFDAELREQVRRALAFGNQCEYCMAKGGPPNLDQHQLRITTATAFADLVGKDHRSVTGDHLDMLRDVFTNAEIAELVAFIAFISASQIFGAVLGLTADDLQVTAGAT